MTTVDFILEGLNANLAMDLSGALSGVLHTALDVSATAVYYVKTSDMKNVFKFQSDSFDVTNDAATDVKYYVYRDATNWPANLKLNPANAAMISPNWMVATEGGVAANKNLVKHDFVRYLAKSLFNTVHGVDLFANEAELLTSLVTGGKAARLDIETALDNVNAVTGASGGLTPNKYATNALTGTSNICRELMLQIVNQRPERFNDLSNNTTGQIISVPLKDGDNFNFKVTVSAAAGQHDLTSVGSIVPRSYGVKIILSPDASENITPIETEVSPVIGEYPYYTAPA